MGALSGNRCACSLGHLALNLYSKDGWQTSRNLLILQLGHNSGITITILIQASGFRSQARPH